MSVKSLATIAWTALVVVAATAGLAFAQASTAAISGLVTDNTGAVLPGVTVTATQTQTGLVRTAVTNETGRYTLPSLPVGSYTSRRSCRDSAPSARRVSRCRSTSRSSSTR